MSKITISTDEETVKLVINLLSNYLNEEDLHQIAYNEDDSDEEDGDVDKMLRQIDDFVNELRNTTGAVQEDDDLTDIEREEVQFRANELNAMFVFPREMKVFNNESDEPVKRIVTEIDPSSPYPIVTDNNGTREGWRYACDLISAKE